MNTVWGDLNFGWHRITSVQGSSMASGTDYDFKQAPDHLLVLVHGIMASPSDWTYAKAELERQLGSNFLIYVSSCNSFTKTFDGVDRAGKRLADEISSVVQKMGSLQRISILAHSLGGLFSRYAVAVLYSTDSLHKDQVDDYRNRNTQMENSLKLGSIAGLEPINFITLATPHLGVRGKKQLPFLLGLPLLEKLAPPIAPILVGRTGRQLFLTDEKPNRPPLLLRMTSNSDDLEFMSSLNSFRNRILYANVSYDHMVGWRTSSIRRETELPKPSLQSLDGYKHIVDVKYCPPILSEAPHFPSEAAKAKEAAQTSSNTQKTTEYYELIEEEMIHGLQRLGWKKVDVSFHSATWPFFAHNNIHVKNEWLYNAGAGVIAHVADSLKHQESRTLIASNL
ncbi:lipid droplet phospholipase 1 isoform X2 [Curcuma longa]